MRAGTSPWLSPKFNSVDVVKMMVEGEKKGGMKVREWASEASWTLVPEGGAECPKLQEATLSAIFLVFDSP